MGVAAEQFRTPELLAPAGDAESLRAALDAGADAVYFGLDQLNARRRARNFQAAELAATVQLIHSRGARAYLALNTDLDQRELSTASRILQLACDARVDAVIVRDLALLELRPQFPALAFHLSTQAGVACSADMLAARDAGVSRVVLAREMSLAEIAAASAVPGIETEVFIQGALCFCISGRCLLSSWTTSRSANRGHCTSPCRFPWQGSESAANATPFSMLDLAAVDRLHDLANAGVTALKIEGRQRPAEWVGAATRLYRQALRANVAGADMLESVRTLSANTGRQSTSGYLDGVRSSLTGLSSRQAAVRRPVPAAEYELLGGQVDFSAYELFVAATDTQLLCRVVFGGRATRFSIPRKTGRTAIQLSAFLDGLSTQPILNIRLNHFENAASDLLITPHMAGQLRDQIASAIRRTPRPDGADVPGYRHHGQDARATEYPADSASGLSTPDPALFTLADFPDRVRLDLAQAIAWSASLPPGGAIVDGATDATLDSLLAAHPADRLIIALPGVFFEEGIPSIRRLITRSAAANVAIEANSLGGLHLARELCPHIPVEAGPGLAVLNSLAAGFLEHLGVRGVTLSLEADRRQFEDLASVGGVPCSLTVFGRPALLITRAEPPDFHDGRVYSNDRGLRLVCRRESGLWAFRPETPFDLRNQRNDNIRAAHLVADLIASPDIQHEWRHIVEKPFAFNYERRLA